MMHVSSGVSGIHPYRWGCMPEVTILELAPREKTCIRMPGLDSMKSLASAFSAGGNFELIHETG